MKSILHHGDTEKAKKFFQNLQWQPFSFPMKPYWVLADRGKWRSQRRSMPGLYVMRIDYAIYAAARARGTIAGARMVVLYHSTVRMSPSLNDTCGE